MGDKSEFTNQGHKIRYYKLVLQLLAEMQKDPWSRLTPHER